MGRPPPPRGTFPQSQNLQQRRRAPRPHLSTSRAAAPHQRPRPAQALDPITAPWRRDWSRGVEAAQRLANGSFAADAFGSRDGLLAATPRQILSEFGKRGNATQAATRAAISAEASLLGLVASFPVCVKGAKELDLAAAYLRHDARAKAGPSREAQEEAVAAVAGVLHRAGVQDLSVFEDRDPKKTLLSFDAQLAHDAAVIQLVEDSYANHRGAATRDAIRAVAESLGLPSPKFHRVADVAELDAATAGLRCAAIEKAGPSLEAQVEAVAALDAALEGAGVQDPSRREDRDLGKPQLSFDDQCARDAATMQSVKDACANRGTVEFPQKLADIVARHADVASWDATARKLVIVDPVRFESEVMPHYFKAREYTSFERQLNVYGFSKVKQSAAEAPRPAGALVYSNTAVADLTKLVRRKSAAPAPAPARTRPSREERATRRTGPAPAAACDLPVRPPRASIQACEARRVGEPWRRFASQSDAARAFPEFDLSSIDISTLINHPSKAKIAVRGRLEARKVTERPAADEASPAPKRPRVQVDDAAAAAVAAVAAPPVLAPTAAAGASPKRAHASSPVGVTARVQFTHLRETRDVDLAGGGSRRRSAAEARAVRGGRAAIVRPGRRAGARCLGRRLLGSAHGVRRA